MEVTLSILSFLKDILTRKSNGNCRAIFPVIYFCFSHHRLANANLPAGMNQMSSVQMGGTFLLVGGNAIKNAATSAILEYVPDAETWRTREETLKEGKNRLGATLVADTVVNCT